MANIVANCQKLLEDELLCRSSQIISVIGDQAYIFGGELRPREPRDNDIHAVSLKGKQAKLTSIPGSSKSPSPRVGTASSTLNSKIYLFSGRGGLAMSPIEEEGGIWEFDPKTSWTLIEPSNPVSTYPSARSYHCMTTDGKETLYIHAGCLESERKSDLWAFNIPRREWTELAPACGPARGGASITFVEDKLYRMNGFDGNTEQGGAVDIYSIQTNSWISHTFSPDGKEGPVPRSVGALLPIRVQDREFLVTLFGERDPSSLGHQGAGKMLSDIWVFDIGERKWEEVMLGQNHGVPLARGWFDADVVGAGSIVVHGGLGESNDRLGDLWTIEFS